jgi:hypothetical protein
LPVNSAVHVNVLAITEEHKGMGSTDFKGTHQVAGRLRAVAENFAKDCFGVVRRELDVFGTESL